MTSLPPFIAPARFTDPAAALARVHAIYDQSISHLRQAMQRFVAGEELYAPAIRWCASTPTPCRARPPPTLPA